MIAVLLAAGCWWAYRSTEGAFTRLLAVGAVTVARRPPKPARHAVRLRSDFSNEAVSKVSEVMNLLEG